MKRFSLAGWKPALHSGTVISSEAEKSSQANSLLLGMSRCLGCARHDIRHLVPTPPLRTASSTHRRAIEPQKFAGVTFVRMLGRGRNRMTFFNTLRKDEFLDDFPVAGTELRGVEMAFGF